MNEDNKAPEVISDKTLDDVNGGLPAVQKVREAAARLGDGSVKPVANQFSSSASGSPNV